MNSELYKKLKKTKITSKKNISFRFFCLSLSNFILLILLFFSITFLIIRDSVFKNNDILKYNVVLNSRFAHYDGGFAQQAIEGVCLSFDIKPKDCNGSHAKFKERTISYGYPYTWNNSKQISDYITNLIETDGDNRVIIMPGFTYSNFLSDFITKYIGKDLTFITLGTTYGIGKERGSKWPSNLWEVRFKEYLSGYYAALYASVYALKKPQFFNDYDLEVQGKQIGFGALGGLFILPIKYYVLGFKLGIEVINKNKAKFTNDPNIELVFHNYKTIGGFELKNALKTKQLALDMYKKGISVIFSVATTLTKDMHSAALEMNKIKNEKSHWVVGVDIDQGVSLYNDSSQKVDDGTDHSLLISAIIKIKEVISDLIKDKIRKKQIPTEPKILENSKFIGIPERFTQTLIWKEIVKKIPDQINISSDVINKIDVLAFKDKEANWLKELMKFGKE